ncbi:MAG: MASE3 domain-containing protein [Candidatus Brocadiia bacterium]
MGDFEEDSQPRWKPAARKVLPSVAVGATALAILYVASRYNYLLFHGLGEGFSIAVACGVFMLAWNSRHLLDNDYLLLLGIAYAFVASIDLLHTLAYSGMGVFPAYGTNLPTQLWIGARYLEAVTLLIAPLALKIRLRPRLTVGAYAVATGLLVAAVFAGLFPDCFVEGEGLTPFKIASEYVIMGLLVGAGVLLYRNRSAFDPGVLWLLLASIGLTIVSELSFTLYADPYSFFNLVGHFLKFVSFYLIYKAVIVTGLARPYDLLYRRLHESERRYRRLFDNMTEGFALHEVITDEDGRPCDYRFLDVNPAFERLTGLKRKEVVGRRVLDVLPETENRWIEAFGEVALTGESVHFEDYSGELDRFYRVFAYQPAPRQFAVVFSDITEQRETRLALRESEERLRALVDNLPFEVWAMDAQGRYIVQNQVCEEAWGKIVGKRAQDVAPSPEIREQWGSNNERAFAGEVVTGEVTAARDGERRVFHNIIAPVKVEDKVRGILGVNVDITDRKRAERELQELNESLEQRVAERTAEVRQQAEQLQALASRLSRAEQRERKRLADILHDHIQQLIVAARMQLGSMKHEDDGDRMRTTAQGVDAILHEALEASRSLTVDLSPPALHRGGLVGGLNWLASRMRERNDFIVNVSSDSRAEPASEEVRFLLFECARELLFNAVKHAGVSEADVSLARTENARIRLVVSDSGKGFNPDELKDRSSDEVTFGLFSIQQRLTYLGGRMDIDSAPGRGTRVTLTAPLGEPGRQESLPPDVREEPTEAVRTQARHEPCRLLIVDDHKMMREGLVGLFEFEPDLQVVGEAADGPEAIEMAQRLAPDVIVMDVNLGEMGGVETTERILAMNPDARIVGLSMHLDDHVADAMRAAGAAAYLTKDAPAEELIAAVRGCGSGESSSPESEHD